MFNFKVWFSFGFNYHEEVFLGLGKLAWTDHNDRFKRVVFEIILFDRILLIHYTDNKAEYEKFQIEYAIKRAKMRKRMGFDK